MKVKELKDMLENLEPNASIYLNRDLEIYEPAIQSAYDSELDENYYLLVKE